MVSPESTLREHLQVVSQLDLQKIEEAAALIKTSLNFGHKILICGNGGSAADAQHLAAEMVVRFQKNRAPMAAIALTTDSSILTACSNDIDFVEIFRRQVNALGREGDVLVCISTSGGSANVNAAWQAAKARGMRVVYMTGYKCFVKPDVAILVPSTITARIQECHVLAIHMICELLEAE